MARRAVMDPLRRTFGSGDWWLLVVQKHGERDGLMLLLLVVYAIYFNDPYPSWLPAWRALDIGYFLAALAGLGYGMGSWMLHPGFMRARSILFLPVDKVSWFACLARPRFLLALLLLHLIGLAFLLLPLWVLVDMAGRYGLNGNVVYESLYGFYAGFGAAGGLVPPAV
jgi:hypothetical protein